MCRDRHGKIESGERLMEALSDALCTDARFGRILPVRALARGNPQETSGRGRTNRVRSASRQAVVLAGLQQKARFTPGPPPGIRRPVERLGATAPCAPVLPDVIPACAV